MVGCCSDGTTPLTLKSLSDAAGSMLHDKQRHARQRQTLLSEACDAFGNCGWCCLQSRVIVHHAEPHLRHLATRWTLLYQDADLSIPLKDADGFLYPHIHVSAIMLHTMIPG